MEAITTNTSEVPVPAPIEMTLDEFLFEKMNEYDPHLLYEWMLEYEEAIQ